MPCLVVIYWAIKTALHNTNDAEPLRGFDKQHKTLIP